MLTDTEYYIMHKNDIVAKAEKDTVTEIISPHLCPHCIVAGGSLEKWVISRSVDVHRSHSRQLYRALRLKENADFYEIIEIGHALTINDNWWVQKSTENLDYFRLKDYNKELADISLYGSSNNKNLLPVGYTQLGTIGSYEKAWRYLNGTWYLYKQGKKVELISEYYAYCFLKELNVNVAGYSVQRYMSETGLEEEYIVSPDFTNNAEVDFEPFFNYYNDNEDYDYIMDHLNEQMQREYAIMTFYDGLLLNVDRHNLNAGFIRNSESGEIISLSPLFDYNLCLSGASKLDFHAESGDLIKYFTQSKKCMSVIKSICPSKESIVKAVNKAIEESKRAFPNDNFNYSLFENYILKAFDYFITKMDRFKENTTLDVTR